MCYASEMRRDERPGAAMPSMASIPSVQSTRGVRARVVLLTLLVQALFVWWVSDSEIVQSVYLICYSLMMPTTLYLLCGGIIRRLFRIERHEFLFSYVVLTCTLPIIGFGGIRFLIPAMGWLSHFSSTQPQWAAYLPGLSSLPVLKDPEAIRSLYKGGAIPWAAWAVPIGYWSALLLLLNGVWIGIAAMMHRVWISYERLTFPITTLPLEMTGPQESPFRRPAFILGAAIPIILQSMLVLHDWYPSFPAFTLKAQDIRPLIFTSPPLASIPTLPVGFYPMAVGLAYFMPGSIALSCLAFWLMIRAVYPLGSALGVESAGTGSARFPYPNEQAAGAWLAFALLAVLAARHHWSGMMSAASPGERRAVKGLGVMAGTCLLGAAALAWGIGVSPAVAIGSAVVYASYVLSGARVRADAGGVWTFAPVTWTPGRVMTELTGGAPASPRPLVAGAMFDLVYIDIRAQSLPFLMEGLKIGDAAGIRRRDLIVWVAILAISALAFGWWFGLHKFYSVGAATAKSNAYALVKVQIGMNEMRSMAGRVRAFDWPGISAVVFGGSLTAALSLLRTRFVGFPLHPVGYVLCNTFSMNSFFVPTLIAWVAKTLVLRYGGQSLYRRSLAFFVGITIGDIGIQTAWTIVGRVFGVPIYQFLT